MFRNGQWVKYGGRIGINLEAPGGREVHMVNEQTGETREILTGIADGELAAVLDVKDLPEPRRRHLPKGYRLRP